PSLRAASRFRVGVGWGTRAGAPARASPSTADAAIIGTKMIQVLQDGPPEGAPARAAEFVAGVRAALDQPRNP
ncbi:MAG TPA: tryptophan synthase subunit alpha, partial [Burkholderiaceae bacterium]|nr:tryptophan synthase subunit alpha [Burkholderiaceae bacterium]